MIGLPINSSATAQQLQSALILKKDRIKQEQTALIRRGDVEKLTALSRSRIYALMAEGKFPRPVQLGAMSVAWLEIEVMQWIADRIADRNTAAGV
jgi:prophage regulatory protein